MTHIDRSFWTGPEAAVVQPTANVQVGALCVRGQGKDAEVLLVKSSRGRWIIPKGWPMEGYTDAEAARIEAWEEAGVLKGKVEPVSVGGYLTEKRYEDGRRRPCHVTVYRIDVKKMTDDYPEAAFRKRKWMPLKKAAKKVNDKGLSDMLRAKAKKPKVLLAA